MVPLHKDRVVEGHNLVLLLHPPLDACQGLQPQGGVVSTAGGAAEAMCLVENTI